MEYNISWPTYLARGPDRPIYHMCPVDMYFERTKNGEDYFSPTYEKDGCIHTTAVPAALLDVGNHFYKNAPGEWICMEINVLLLTSKVIYEGPTAVGDTEALKTEKSPVFPHIYGGINKNSVIKLTKIRRHEDGTFLGIEGLC